MYDETLQRPSWLWVGSASPTLGNSSGSNGETALERNLGMTTSINGAGMCPPGLTIMYPKVGLVEETKEEEKKERNIVKYITSV
jgi:hypothetical protein